MPEDAHFERAILRAILNVAPYELIGRYKSGKLSGELIKTELRQWSEDQRAMIF